VIRRGVTTFAFGVALCVGAVVARADLSDDAWKRGNDAFLRGDYHAATTAYEQLDRQGIVSADLAYNLGNAYYRQGQVGRAIWAWERALALNPDADDARYNLERARKAAARTVQDKLEGADRDPLWIRAVTELSLSTETWLFVVVYVGLFVALALHLRARRQAPAGGAEVTPLWGALAAMLGAAAALAGILLLGRVALDRTPFAVVLPDQLAIKEGADANYRTTFQVHAGLRVRVLERDQGWVRIRLANGLEGWAPDQDVGRL
jgi:tetratricopeptide (TPR) repeat protein